MGRRWYVVTRLRDESGTTIVEYGLLLALIAVVVGFSATLLAEGIGDVFGAASQTVSDQSGTQNNGSNGNGDGWGQGIGGGQGHK